MSYLEALLMLMRWAREGWEVHPIVSSEEFEGWL